MTSNHHAPYDLGYTRATMAPDRGRRTREGERIPKTASQFGRSRVLYTPPVTPWESATPEVSDPTARRELPKVGPITGVKS